MSAVSVCHSFEQHDDLIMNLLLLFLPILAIAQDSCENCVDGGCVYCRVEEFLKVHSRNAPVVSTAFSDRAATMRLVLHPSVRRGIVNSTIQTEKLF